MQALRKNLLQRIKPKQSGIDHTVDPVTSQQGLQYGKLKLI